MKKFNTQPTINHIIGKHLLKEYKAKFNKQDNELYKQHIENKNAYSFLLEKIWA